MKQKTDAFLKLVDIFSSHHHSLYLVGGTVRDILLYGKSEDMDVVTDATPEEMKAFLNGDFTFAKMGSVKVHIDGVKFDITTLREENEYLDFRHPSEINFVKTIEEDFKRRDFTINALYMDKNLKVIDLVGGVSDLNKKIIRMVGDPYVRLKEDPLRIIRAIRFALMLNFEIDEELEKAIESNKIYLEKLTKDKIVQEIKKIKDVSKETIINIFNKYSIQYLIDMIK